MKIVIAGGSGFLGGALAAACAEDGHDVVVLTRALPAGAAVHDAGTGMPGITRVGWTPDGRTGHWATAIDGSGALINLAGAGIGDRRWTPARKVLLRDSRILATRSLVAALDAAATPPPVFVSASAVGYYGTTGDEIRTEASPAGGDFLAGLCEAWEAEARSAERVSMRVALLRTGIVLEKSGGALARMATPFRLMAGGPMGSGRQYMSWIHRLDWIEMVRWVLGTPEASGALNLTAPTPVANREFASALGRAMGRPALVPAPAFALRALLGEMADPLVLRGQRVVPARAQALGYRFRYPELSQALTAIMRE